jgi:dTDP-4-amino-4,6-dideoxygalactose transaminase
MTGNTPQNTFHLYRGRVALYTLLKALAVKAGDEVLLQAFTCLAVPIPIVGLSAKPVYLDIAERTYNLDPKQLERHVTERTKAIIVQHTFGNPNEMSVILAVARKHKLAVIEDCCHVLGSKYNGADLGCIGDAAFYSYEWGKPVVIGLGGTAVVHSEAMLDRVRHLYEAFESPPVKDTILLNLQYIAHSILRRPTFFWAMRDIYRALSKLGLSIGTFGIAEFEGRINDEYRRKMAASFQRRLEAKLRDVKTLISHRKWVAAQYENGLRQLGLECVASPEGAETVFLRYPILTRDKVRVLQEAKRRKVELGDWFATPIHPLTEEQWKNVGYEKGSCPVAEDVCRRAVTLPIYERVGAAAVDRMLGFLSDMRARGAL